jgi:hypothetical protein
MHSISRRRFVRTLAGVPFLMAAPWRAFAAHQSGSLSGSQIESVKYNAENVKGNWVGLV